jgi:CdiI immunity protein
MTHFDASRFPELRRVFEGYLHEDFVQEHGTAPAAIAAFHADATPAEQRRFRDESRRFLAATSSLAFAQVQRYVARLGSRWIPASRDELATVLDA